MRTLKRIVIIVVIVAGLGVVADRVLWWFATDSLRTQLNAQGAHSATVSIAGFPFITQVAAQRLSHVHLHTPTLTRATDDRSISLHNVDIDARGLDVDIQHQSLTNVRQLHISGIMPLSVVAQSFADSGVTVHLNVVGDQIQAEFPTSYGISLTTTLALSAGPTDSDGHPTLLVTPSHMGLTIGDTQLGDLPFPSIPIPLKDLPKGIGIDRVSVTQKGIALTLSGKNVDLSNMRSTAHSPRSGYVRAV